MLKSRMRGRLDDAKIRMMIKARDDLFCLLNIIGMYFKAYTAKGIAVKRKNSDHGLILKDMSHLLLLKQQPEYGVFARIGEDRYGLVILHDPERMY